MQVEISISKSTFNFQSLIQVKNHSKNGLPATEARILGVFPMTDLILVPFPPARIIIF